MIGSWLGDCHVCKTKTNVLPIYLDDFFDRVDSCFFHTVMGYVKISIGMEWIGMKCSIKGPRDIKGYIGENATFMWNTTDQKEIFTASWGIRKGPIADPQYINVNGYSGKMNINNDLDARTKTRVKFIGDLKKGHAWFVLKNLTLSDTNEYIASISDDERTVLPYPVLLVVQKREEGFSYTTGSTAAPENTTTKPTQGFSYTTGSRAVSANMTTPGTSTATTVRGKYCNLMIIAIVLFLSIIILDNIF